MSSMKDVTQRYNDAIPTRFPDKVKCSLCERNLMADKFSNKQRQLFLNALKNNGGKPVPLLNHPKCTKCTGQQNVEMTCKFCEVTKGLDQFSKNQRNNPDEARCWDCCQTHLEELAGTNAVEAEQLKDSSVGTSIYARTDWTLDRVTNISNKITLSEIESNAESRGSSGFADVDNEDDYDTGDDAVWVSQAKAPAKIRTQPQVPSTFTGYDNTGRAYQQQRSPSVASSATGTAWDNFSTVERPSPRRSTYTSSVITGSDRFAKVRPVTLTVDEINEAREKREKEAEQSRMNAVDKDDDSDSDEELPY